MEQKAIDLASPTANPRGRGDNFFTATFTNSDQLTRFDETLATIGFTMPVAALRGEGWALERPEVLALMDKLRTVGKPLGEYVDGKIFYGIKTGLNEAFVIDEETKARLIAEDPKSAEIIKPWLRGRDIKQVAGRMGGAVYHCHCQQRQQRMAVVTGRIEINGTTDF